MQDIRSWSVIAVRRWTRLVHYDVVKWKHFPHYRPFVRGIHGGFPSQRPVTRNLDVFLDLRWTKGRTNNRDTGDLRRHRAHYDVTVMFIMGIFTVDVWCVRIAWCLFGITTYATIMVRNILFLNTKTKKLANIALNTTLLRFIYSARLKAGTKS